MTGREEPLDRLMRTAARMLDAPVAFVRTAEAERDLLRGVCGCEAFESRSLTLPDALVSAVEASAGVLAVDDVRRWKPPMPVPLNGCAPGDDGAAPAGGGLMLAIAPAATAAAAPWVAYLIASLRSPGGLAIGMLVVADRKPRSWTARHIELLREVADLTVATMSETCERREAIRALTHSEQRYRALIEHSTEGIWCFEFEVALSTPAPPAEQIAHMYRHGYIAECNDALAQMHGRRCAVDMLGKRLDTLFPGDADVELSLDAFIEAGYRLQDMETCEPQGDGLPRRFLHTLIGIVENDVLVRIWGTQRDITERRALEEQLRQSQKMQAVGRLAGGVAHDFNNLLTAIQGHADLGLDELEEASPLWEPLSEIRKAAERATSLTRQLLAFSRKQVLRPRVLDLNDIVSNMEKMLRRLIGEDIELTTVLQSPLGRVRGDAGQLEQVVLNLVVNARDAMPSGGRLSVRTSDVHLDEAFAQRRPGVAPGHYVRLSVRDTGVGMDAETLSHIFEPFFTTKATGTGLGLATVYGIVQQCAGHVFVNSEPGRGTVFQVYLPVVDADVAPPPPEPEPTGSLDGTETILLVEDEDGVRGVASKVLRMRGYTVVEADSGAAALRAADAHPGPIDLLLTDIVMPGMGGAELASVLLERDAHLCVVYMSGYTEDEAFRNCTPGTRQSFMEKPFTPDKLVRGVRAALDAAAEPV